MCSVMLYLYDLGGMLVRYCVPIKKHHRDDDAFKTMLNYEN